MKFHLLTVIALAAASTVPAHAALTTDAGSELGTYVRDLGDNGAWGRPASSRLRASLASCASPSPA